MGKQAKQNSNIRRIFPLKIRPLYIVGGMALVLATGVLVAAKFYRQENLDISESASKDLPEYQIRRAAGYKFIRPLLSAKPVSESSTYAEIKKAVGDFITAQEYNGVLLTASLYLRDFDNANWTSINADEKYTPGSILKIPLMMTILENEEATTGFLNRKIPFTLKLVYAKGSKQFIVPKYQIEYGKSYTYEELLRYMIVYSDNLAYTLLRNTISTEVQDRLYEELGLPKPTYDSLTVPLTVRECSVFMESLINASVLNRNNSEYALDMLTRTTFKDGVVKGIADSTILIAHKFAEGGTTVHKELHETAVVYLGTKPYLLTIMTRGKDNVDYAELATVIQGIARIIHEGLVKINSTADLPPTQVSRRD
jgi:beta-lactamase class A